MTSQFDIFNPPPRWRPEGFDELKLTGEERRVTDVLKFHVGAMRAITVDEIAKCLQGAGSREKESRELAPCSALHAPRSGQRKIREILKHLTETHGLAIASSVKEPYGVFLVGTAEELEAYCKNLKGRALSALHRMAVLKKQHLPELLGQLQLEAGSRELKE